MDEEEIDETAPAEESEESESSDIPYPDPIDFDFGYKKGAPERSYPDWAKDERTKLLSHVGSEAREFIRSCASARSGRDQMIRSMQEVLNLIPADVDSPLGEDGSTLTTPLTFEMFSTIHAFLYKVVTGVRPFIRTESYSPDDTTRANAVEGYYDILYNTDEIDFKSIIDELIRLTLSHGSGFICNGWRRSFERIRTQVRLKPTNYSFYGFESPLDPSTLVSGSFLKHKETGKTAQIGQIIDVSETVPVFDNPSLDVISYFDFFMYPARSATIDAALLKGYRFDLSISDIKNGVISGIYDEKMASILFDQKPPTEEIRSVSEVYLEDSDKVASADEDDIGVDTLSARGDNTILEMVRFTYRVDGDDDGYAEEWMFVMETSTGIILSANRYDGRPGRSWITPLPLYPRPGSIYGMPLPQILEGVQEEMDTTTRQIMDAGTLALTFIVAMNKATRDSLPHGKLSPGMNIIVSDNPEKDAMIRPVALDLNPAIMPSFDVIRSLAEKATAASEAMSGVASNESKTATEINQVLNAGSRRLEVLVSRVWRCIVRAHENLHYQLARRNSLYGDGMNESPVPYPIYSHTHQLIDSGTTSQDWDVPMLFIGNGDPVNTNLGLKLQAAEKVLISSTQSPFMQDDLQRRHFAETFFLSAYGIRNTTDFIGTLSDAQKKQQQQERNPPPQVPNLPPNLNPQFLSVYVAQNPELGDAILKSLEAVSKAIGAKDDAADKTALQTEAMRSINNIEQTRMKLEMDAARKKHELDMSAGRLEQISDKANMDARLNMDRMKNQERSIKEARRAKPTTGPKR